jgi:hypothetical protein
MAYVAPAKQPVPPKKPLGLLIGLGVAAALAVIFGGAAGVLFGKQSAATKASASHEAGLTALASAVGQPLEIPTNAPMNWQAAWDSLTGSLSNLVAEGAAAKTRVTELEAQVDEFVLAQAQAQQTLKTAQDKAAAGAEAEKALADLKASSQQQIADLQKQVETAKAEAAAAQQKAEEAAAAAAARAAAAQPAAEAGAETAAPAETVAAAGDAPPAAAPAAEAAEADTDGSHAFTAKQSQLLKRAGYDADTQTMTLTLANGKKLKYSEVPGAAYEALLGAPVVDVFYRMRILGVFKSTPDDKAAIRELND